MSFSKQQEKDEILEKYLTYLRNNGRKESTVESHRSIISVIARTLPLDTITKENVEACVAGMRKQYKPSTFETRLTILKFFTAWSFGEAKKKFRPKTEAIFEELSPPKHKKHTITSDDVVFPDEAMEFVRATTNERDALAIISLFEGGFRANELLNTNIRDWHLCDGYVKVQIRDGKTGSRESPPMPITTHYLKKWLEQHPDSTNPNAPMFTSLGRGYDKQLGYMGLRMMFEAVQRRAGKGTDYHLHDLRRGCCSYLHKMGYDHKALCEALGWQLGSTIPLEVYQFVDKGDEDIKFLIATGNMPEPEGGNGDKPLTLLTCVCGEENPPNALFCHRCGTALSYEAIQRRQEEEVETRDALLTLSSDEQATLKELLRSNELRKMMRSM